ncbi:MAG: PstS family phosphate ABC transporter substrate-binding protein [Chloroflexi bacterium]|nr:PstS family phosphate ABC transporter substrate-binding protein [Chloroflexota bacterium]
MTFQKDILNPTQRRWLLLLITGLAAFALVAVACGDDAPGPAATEGPANEDAYAGLSGEVRIDGSSTVFPIAEAMAEEFGLVSDVRVNVAFSGTGGGFEKFCRGETQISNASRPIKDLEREACAENGIDDIVEIQVAIDALTVMIHPDNDFAQCMTVPELNKAFRADGARKWSDLRPEWPDDDIVAYYPGADSGTFDYFNEAIIEEFEGSTHRGDGTPSEDDNILALGIGRDKNAIGYFGFAYFLEAGQGLQAVAVDDGHGCVAPSFEAALSGEYTPLSRPLFIYTRASFLNDRPEVAGFARFFLESVDTIVPEVGYVTMPAALLAQQFTKITPPYVLLGQEVPAPAPVETDYSRLSGEIRIDGSSTVFPIAEAMAEEFGYVSDVRVNVAFSGTGGGFEKFCRGETQISDASRPIKDSERESCAENGIDDIVEIQVAIDALTVMIHPDNDFAQCMTVPELNQAFRADGAKKWSDLRPEWPDDDIVAYYPGADSGTFDYFNEAIIEEFEGSTHRGDGTPSEDDNILALGIGRDKNAIGYFGFAYFLEAGQGLQAVAVDDGHGCVAPSFEAALSGEYTPLSRPLFIYTRASLLSERPELAGFIQFFLEQSDAIVPEVGYVTMPADLLAEQFAKIAPHIN